MPTIRLLLDECTDPEFARQLRTREYDAIHVEEVNRKGLSDAEQVAFAFEQGRAIATYNAKDYQPIHTRMMMAGQEHAGIIISEDYKTRVGAYLRDLCYTLEQQTQRNGGGTEWIRNQMVFVHRAPQ